MWIKDSKDEWEWMPEYSVFATVNNVRKTEDERTVFEVMMNNEYVFRNGELWSRIKREHDRPFKNAIVEWLRKYRKEAGKLKKLAWEFIVWKT